MELAVTYEQAVGLVEHGALIFGQALVGGEILTRKPKLLAAPSRSHFGYKALRNARHNARLLCLRFRNTSRTKALRLCIHLQLRFSGLKVTLLFEPKLAIYITERDWHPTQQFRMRRDGHVEMRMETTDRKELIRWVLSWMPDVKVVTPKSLRDRITEKLRDGLQAQR